MGEEVGKFAYAMLTPLLDRRQRRERGKTFAEVRVHQGEELG